MSYECKFCKKKFSSKSNLNYHEINTKYCLEIQGVISLNIECDYCKKKCRNRKNTKNSFIIL